MQNAGLDEAQVGIKIARRNINNLRYADETKLMAESEELESLLMKVKEESKKVGLKLNKFMVSSPITSWQIEEGKMETVRDSFSWAPKSLQMVTAAMKLKDTPWKKSYDQPSVQFSHSVFVTPWIAACQDSLSITISHLKLTSIESFGAQLSSQSNSRIHTWPLEKP